MDDNLYKQKQNEWLAEFEALCKRCGACCGVETDPCANLVKSPDGGYTCKIYEDRLGAQKTVSGKNFTCVPINEVINKGMPHSVCGYITLNDR